MMWQSLLKIRNLPADTQIFCGHEYTAANVHFALTIEPKNTALRARAEEVVKLVEQKKPTIPTTVAAGKILQPVPARGPSLGRGRHRHGRRERRERVRHHPGAQGQVLVSRASLPMSAS